MSTFDKHIIIVGTARSGTSWLSETIAQQHRYRMLFEPEHETQTKKGILLCDQWVQSQQEAPQAHHYLKQIFANRVDCDWIAQHSNRKFKRHLLPLLAKKYVIKFVRANLLAHYMNATFQIPIIHVIRNPYDVLFSQQRANFTWLTDLQHFADQKALVNLIKEQFQFDITDTAHYSTLELLAIRWCIENAIPLEVFGPYPHKSLVVRYEELYEDVKVFYKLCSDFDLKPVEHLESIYKLPSSKTHHNSSIKTKKVKQLSYEKFELQQINTILDAFKTKLYPRRH